MLLGTYIWGDSGVKIINFLLMFYDNSYYYSFALNKQLSYHWKLDILWVFNYHSGCKLPFQKSLKTGYFFTFAYHSGCKNPDFFSSNYCGKLKSLLFFNWQNVQSSPCTQMPSTIKLNLQDRTKPLFYKICFITSKHIEQNWCVAQSQIKVWIHHRKLSEAE